MNGGRKAQRAVDEHNREKAAPAGGQSIIESAAAPRLPASGPFWGELHTFLAVAEHRSVTRAAEILGLGRATVTRQIRRLQDVLGQQLLVLTKHGAFLTPKGDELFRELARIDRDVVAATATLRARGTNPEGDVRIGISDGLGFVFLLPKIEAFSREYPDIHLHLTRPLPFEALRENKIDVAVGFEPELGPDILCEELGCVHFVPFAGRKYIARHGVPSPTSKITA
jgi:DNA-binding transcriptional LysR family regulator